MELKVIDVKGQEAGVVQLDEKLLPLKSKDAVVHEVVTAYLAGLRSGTHAVKTRAEVSGGGIKPWRQKGTGRARSGSIRSPLWRKGGIIFGPEPRSYKQELPRKKKQLAFRIAFMNLVNEGRIQVVEDVKITEPKTKNVAAIYAKWQAPAQSVLVIDKLDPTFARASRNIENVCVIDAESFNTYDLLRARRVFVTKPAFDQLTARMASSLEN